MLKYAGKESLFSHLELPVIPNINLVATCNLFKRNVLMVFFVLSQHHKAHYVCAQK